MDKEIILAMSQSLRKSGQFLSVHDLAWMLDHGRVCRNPFVNQVSFFESEYVPTAPPGQWGSQSLRKSGQFL